MAWLLRRGSLTNFERIMLIETAKVDFGGTVTYAKLAKNIGNQGAARAVGNALNKNPLPLLIPCHRVVSQNGIGGYRYGIKAKAFLLNKVRVCVTSSHR